MSVEDCGSESAATANASLAPSDRRALFRALYENYATDVYRYVHRRCHDQALAEDITQDTFLTAVRTIEDPRTVNRGWLMTVARNKLFDLLRRHNTRSDKLRLIADGAVGQTSDDDLVVERLRLEEALAKLTVSHRLVLSMHYLDAMTVEAIADELGRSSKSVEGLVTRARRNLRRELEVNTDV
ncbi:MAG: RNA polymerase sigma factor [Acidimicrobiales bacterium]